MDGVGWRPIPMAGFPGEGSGRRLGGRRAPSFFGDDPLMRALRDRPPHPFVDIDPPEIGLSRFAWGAPGTLDCDDTANFDVALMVPLFIADGDLPAEYCVVSYDQAGNATPVTRINIPAP